MKTDRRALIRSTLLAGSALCATLLVPAAASAQDSAVLPERRANQATTAQPGDPAADGADVDLDEAPQVGRMLQDEATHRQRLARIHRLRELAQQGNQRERLAQLDDLERRETTRHEARAVVERARLSERSARGLDNIVRRGGRFHAAGRDVSIARERKFGSSGDRSVRRGGSDARPAAERAPSRPSTSTPPRSPSRPSGGSRGGGRGPR